MAAATGPSGAHAHPIGKTLTLGEGWSWSGADNLSSVERALEPPGLRRRRRRTLSLREGRLETVAKQTAPTEREMHQIGEVADAVGLSLRTIRHYEEVDLVPPSGRSNGGFRLYTDDDIERLRLVKHMKPLDFSLEEMRELLGALDRLAEGVEGGRRRQLLERVAMYAAAADARCEKLREQLQRAETMARMLRREAGRKPSRTRSRR